MSCSVDEVRFTVVEEQNSLARAIAGKALQFLRRVQHRSRSPGAICGVVV